MHHCRNPAPAKEIMDMIYGTKDSLETDTLALVKETMSLMTPVTNKTISLKRGDCFTDKTNL